MSISAGIRFAARRLRRAVERRPVVIFDPSPGLRAFDRSEARRICLIAANRVGKSYHAARKMAKAMILRPGLRCRAVGPTNKVVNQVHAGYLYKFLKDYLKPGCSWNARTGFSHGNVIELKNGSICQLLSYEQSVDSHAGDDLDIVWLDEPPPIGIYMEADSRVFRRNGALWLTFTAVGRPVAWLKKIVLDTTVDEDLRWEVHSVALSPENVPWMPRRQVLARIRRMKATPWQYAQRILGAWDGVSDGRRLSAFSDRRVVPLGRSSKQDWPMGGELVNLLLAADYGVGPGHSAWLLIGWQVVSRDRHGAKLYIRVIGEWTNPKRMSVASEARAVAKMVLAAGMRLGSVMFAVGDVNTAGKSVGSRSMNEAFESEFARIMKLETPKLRFRHAKKGGGSIDYGVVLCNQLFDSGELFVAEACNLLTEACNHWEGKDDDLKHKIDAMRYGVHAICMEEGAEPVLLEAA